MRAIVIREPGGPEVLELRDVPDPQPGRGEVRVRVRAAGVNRADIMQRLGLYPAPPGWPADVPGMEVAGEVDALGDDVRELACGDRVFGVLGGGGYAEQVVAHARTLARIPEGTTFADAAAVPEAFITAWDAMVLQARLSAGEKLLVHAVGSGVGTAGVQIGRAVGASVIGTARSADKTERARELGLTHAIVVDGSRFADRVLALTIGHGADVVLDLVGGPYVAEDLACAAPCGRIMVVGLTGGREAQLDLSLLMHKRVQIRGTTLRARPLEEKILAGRVLQHHIVPLLASGAVHAVVDRVLPLAQAAEAHRLIQSNATFGKIVLEP